MSCLEWLTQTFFDLTRQAVNLEVSLRLKPQGISASINLGVSHCSSQSYLSGRNIRNKFSQKYATSGNSRLYISGNWKDA